MTEHNPLTVSPDELRVGDKMFVTVKLLITATGYRVYRCMPGQTEGSRVPPETEKAIAEALFPIISWTEYHRDRM